MRFAAASALAALTLTITGCGGSDNEAADSPPAPPTTTQATTETMPPPVGGTDVGVYFVREDKLGYAARSVGLTPKVATAALEVGFNDPLVGAIIQHKAPRGMASFLQRKGRAGRVRAGQWFSAERSVDTVERVYGEIW